MKKWLSENALWLGSIGALAAVLTLVWSILAPAPDSNLSIKEGGDGSVVTDSVEGSTITINNGTAQKE